LGGGGARYVLFLVCKISANGMKQKALPSSTNSGVGSQNGNISNRFLPQCGSTVCRDHVQPEGPAGEHQQLTDTAMK
jgi:hypothetical protein